MEALLGAVGGILRGEGYGCGCSIFGWDAAIS